MKKTICTLIMLSILIAFSCSCTSSNPDIVNNDKPTIVCTSFASYDWICNILGEKKSEWNLVRLNESGTDMHSFQPSAKDITYIADSDLLVFTGGISEEWIDETTNSASDYDGIVYSLIGEEHDHSHDEGICEIDEHIWLSPKNAIVFCEELAKQISIIDPSGEEQYMNNADIYIEKLKNIDNEYEQALKECKNKTVIFADRFPFHYLTEDYGISYYAAFPGCSAETEASFETVIYLSEKANELNIPALLITEHSSDSIAQTIINTSGRDNMEIFELNSMQSVNEQDIKNNITYISVMENNLNVLKKVLN